MKNGKYLWVLVPLLFTGILFTVLDHGPRFEDENIAIMDGRYFVDAFRSTDPAFLNTAARFNGLNSIGLPVAVPAGIARMTVNDIVAPRVTMALWACFYCFMLLACLYAACRRLDASFFRSPWHKALLGFLFLCFVQGVPESYVNQIEALGEFPGIAVFLAALACFFAGKTRQAVLLAGASVIIKVNFLIYFPAVILAGLLLSKDLKKFHLNAVVKQTLMLIAIYFTVPVLTQFLKMFAYGPAAYFRAWIPYWEWVSTYSGAGIKSFGRSVNEWPNYSWRTKAYYILAAVGPLAALSALLKKKLISARVALAIGALIAMALLGSAQWYFMADYKWWRRALFFVVPGYAFTAGTVLVLIDLETRKRKAMQAGRAAIFAGLIVLALYVCVRQSFLGFIENKPKLTIESRQQFDWNSAQNIKYR